METSSTPANPTSTSIFAVPCPGCGTELVPLASLASSTYACPRCAGRYRASLGYLVPLAGRANEAS